MAVSIRDGHPGVWQAVAELDRKNAGVEQPAPRHSGHIGRNPWIHCCLTRRTAMIQSVQTALIDQDFMRQSLQKKSTYTSDDARWAAVLRRDRAADDQFFYSVRTTGVYCRPSCASRTAR